MRWIDADGVRRFRKPQEFDVDTHANVEMFTCRTCTNTWTQHGPKRKMRRYSVCCECAARRWAEDQQWTALTNKQRFLQ